ncbi:1-(5-phosphoribosyl)-5-[(5-phosphoribosylamino)methylideneamino] imidazole-4-carboxamide isomerase [Gimesia panareensis]|uniref:1-(5-phosphoribosyl)-5-[(5-phosphoribosylamino)methylideneamino] imidazole-4-carboxamide isomerase n=1 Tax=Gimesia panareensis TaxID=2527978 RepID=A0A518FPR7_9PLAN|nr:HisA/HisF-related TIM barrel protein [Gimesia panareensis]QDV18338.1 1-(5-phosphoribosyl)-5-[(5-phosphoribosylamino)methylideneamino] imidazole-4-carboxamide isomerase [Gimesia panareensis]
MKIIPVLDILNQTVVRGVAGERDTYRPLQSELTRSSEPLDLARAIRDEFGLSEFYVADLDAILYRRQNQELYQRLLADGFTFLLDCGLRTPADSELLKDLVGITIVAGLETLAGAAELNALVRQWGPERTVFSLDLKQGQPLVNSAAGNPFSPLDDPLDVADLARAQGIAQMILLDLAQVGTGQGTGTEALCKTLRTQYPELTLITGGGIRNAEELQAQAALGADGVLVASALHDGRIGRDTVLSLS